MALICAIIEIPYKKRITENTRLDEEFSIVCQVPYSSEYCFIRAPNNTKYEADSSSNSLIGECIYKFKHIQKDDNGTWQCIFATQMGRPMDVIYYDVSTIDYYYSLM